MKQPFLLLAIITLLCLLNKLRALITLTESSKLLSSYQTLATGVTYNLVFTMSGSIPASSIVQIALSDRFILPATLTNCKASISSGASLTSRICQTDSGTLSNIKLINIQGLFSSTAIYTYIAIQFTIDNPWAQVSETINVYVKKTTADAPDASGAVSIDYVASTMASCTVTSSSQLTGAGATHTISMTPSRKLISGMFLLVYMPFWYNTIGSLNSSTLVCTGLQGTDSGNLGCNIYTFGVEQTLNITSLFTSNKTLSTPIQISLQTLRNPWNTQQFGPFRFQLAGSQSYVSQRCTNMVLKVTQANQLVNAQLFVTNFSISSFTSNTFIRISVKNPVPKDKTRLRMTFPNDLTVVYSKPATIVSQNSTELLISNITTGVSENGQFILSLFNITFPPHTRPFTIKYTTQLFNNSITYLIDTKQISYTVVGGQMTSATVGASSNFINKNSVYTITFTTTNTLVVGSFIRIIFPSVLTINTGNGCSTNASSQMTCSASTTSNITLNITASVPKNSRIAVVVANVTNGPQAILTASFQIYSYYIANDFTTIVDSLSTGVAFTLVANPVSSPVITPTSFVTFATTDYNFSMTLSDPIPVGGYIVIEFPVQISPASAAISSASFSTSTCVVNKPSTQVINITGCFPASVMSNLNFQLVLSGIRNPRSVQPTSGSFKIYTYDSVSLINYVTSGLSVTMTTATNVNTLTIVPDSSTVHASTTYSVTVTHTVSTHQANDYFYLSLPAPMVFPASPACSVNTGVTNVNCVRQNISTLKVQYLGVPNLTVAVRIGAIRNYDIGDTAINFGFQFYTASGFLSEVSPAVSLTYNQDVALTVTVNNDHNIAINDSSTVTLTVTTPFALDSSFDPTLTSLIITIPPQFTIGTSCSSSAGSCAPLSSSQYRVSQIGLQVTSVPVILTNMKLPYFSPFSTTFKVQYLYNSLNVSVINSGIVVQVYCTSPCKRCNITKTDCLSCLGPPNTLIYYDPDGQDCLIECVSGKYPDATNECKPCLIPCATCDNSADCKTCTSGTWLHLKRCQTVCPSTFYNASSGLCVGCKDPCKTCTTISACTSCLTKYLTGTNCVDPQNCPVGTFPNATSLKCQTCTPPCGDCDTSPTSCTACAINYLYISTNKTCVQNCPQKMYKVANECFFCGSPCDSCISATNCTSCLNDFLSNGKCVLPSDCPAGTYPDAVSKRCQVCPTGCVQCQSASNCTSCNGPVYFFYKFACITSCPTGTFKDGTNCLDCDPPCSSCVNTSTTCTGCKSPKYFHINQCLGICPDGFYQNNALSICSPCLSTCDTCSTGSSCDTCLSGFFRDAGGNCVTNCPNGAFEDTVTKTCVSCDPPCTSCQLSATNCTACKSPQLQFKNTCLPACPAQFFNVSGHCQTCSQCLNCLDAQTCIQCKPTLYIYKGVCYQSCPLAAPIQNQETGKCGGCDEKCASCQGIGKNCTGCFNGQYLFNNDCISTCPTGYIAEIATGKCIQPLIGRVIYFPCSFAYIACVIILIYSKCRNEQTQVITTLAALTSLCEYISWFIVSFILQLDATINSSITQIFFFVGFGIIGANLVVGVTYNVIVYFLFECDRGFQGWKEFEQSCVYSYRVITILSGLNFKCFRFLYSRIFNRIFFSVYFADAQRFLSITNKLSYAAVVLFSFPMVAICAVSLYYKQQFDQTFFSCIDTMILGSSAMVLVIIDTCKDKSYFQNMEGSLPFLKYRGLEGESLVSNNHLISRDHLQQQERPLTDASEQTKQRIFRNIKFLPNLNKFGHLNVIDDRLEDKDQTKSLPQEKELKKMQGLDPNKIQDDRVIDDLFFQEDQQQLQRQRQQQLQLKRQQQQKRKKRLQEEEQQRVRREEQQRLRKLRQQEDEREQVDVQFQDIAIIQKHQGTFGKDKKNPLQMLSRCKKADQKQIGEKQKKKLTQIAKKNGIDPNFMQETFGVQKNHNAQLLNSIIDKHHGVKRDSVKQLFSEQNNKQVMQQIFGKNSDMDKEKLKLLMNDPNSNEIIKKLASDQQGIVSAQMAKQLLSKDSKYTPKFMTQLLGGSEQMSQDKLKQLLKDAKGKGKQSPLKALQKVGGKNLQNKQVLKNMLGQDSILKPESFTRVANDLSAKAIENLFKNRSQSTDTITNKLLNNKKIGLKGLAPILQDQQLIQELAKAYGNQNPNVQENLTNLFKNAQDIDPQKLRNLLNDPVLKKKLLQNPIDPEFLTQILKKDSNTNFQLLSKAIKDMPDQQVQQIFKFSPQKNTDYKALATLFDYNAKTDPQLVIQMLDPKMVIDLYSKGNNDPKRLLKLVQKGSNFDPQVILGIYGKNNGNIFDQQGVKDEFGFMNKNNKKDTKNMTTYDPNSKDDYLSQKGGPKAFGNMKNNMSRTDGGQMGFLSPLKHTKARVNGQDFVGDLINRQTKYQERNQLQQQDQQGQQIYYEQDVKKKRPKRKKKKLGFNDIRLGAEQIYLQRLQAPHQAQIRKNSIRKKKQKANSSTNLFMDQENDVIDLDF